MKKLCKLCAVILLLCAVAAAPVIYRGFQLYQYAMETTSVEEKVSEIRDNAQYVPLSDMDEYFVQEIIKSEDKRFYLHFGVDLLAIARAVKNDLIAGGFVEGGSTITQQLAKNMYFEFDKVMERKVAEVLVAFQIEHKYTKDEILELYLNCIYFGENCYGIREASEHYYSKAPGELTREQADSLVFTIKCPNLYNPVALAENSAE